MYLCSVKSIRNQLNTTTMENKNKQLAEKLVNVFVNHELYKENREDAIETLNRYRRVLNDLELLPEEVDKEVKQRVNELRAK